MMYAQEDVWFTFVSIPPSFLACCISLMWSFCISFSYSSTMGPLHCAAWAYAGDAPHLTAKAFL